MTKKNAIYMIDGRGVRGPAAENFSPSCVKKRSEARGARRRQKRKCGGPGVGRDNFDGAERGWDQKGPSRCTPTVLFRCSFSSLRSIVSLVLFCLETFPEHVGEGVSKAGLKQMLFSLGPPNTFSVTLPKTKIATLNPVPWS